MATVTIIVLLETKAISLSAPHALKDEVLTTGLPGKSLIGIIKSQRNEEETGLGAEILITNTDLGAVLLQLTVYLGTQIIDR